MSGKESNFFWRLSTAKKSADDMTKQEPAFLWKEAQAVVWKTIGDMESFFEVEENTFSCSGCGARSSSSDSCSSCGFYLAQPQYAPPHNPEPEFFNDAEIDQIESDEIISQKPNDWVELWNFDENLEKPLNQRSFTKDLLCADLSYGTESFMQDAKWNISLVFKVEENSSLEFLLEWKVIFKDNKNIQGQSQTAVNVNLKKVRFSKFENWIKTSRVNKSHFTPRVLERLESIIKGKSRVM